MVVELAIHVETDAVVDEEDVEVVEVVELAGVDDVEPEVELAEEDVVVVDPDEVVEGVVFTLVKFEDRKR